MAYSGAQISLAKEHCALGDKWAIWLTIKKADILSLISYIVFVPILC